MAKGEIFYNKFSYDNDKLTSKKIMKITSEGGVNHHPYFYNRMITGDNKKLIYCSDRDGLRNIYMVDLETGETKGLTSSKTLADFSPCLTSDDKYVIFADNDSIIRLKLDSLKEECLYTSENNWLLGSFGLSSDDKVAVINETNQDDIVQSKGDWSTFESQWEKKPNCRLVYLDIENKSYHVVHNEQHCWLGHSQVRPGVNTDLSFCHEGPGPKIDARIWLIDSDGKNHACATPRTPDEMVTTHEYWLYDGSKIAFMHRQTNERTTIRYVDPKTLEQTELLECSHFCHFISNEDNSFMVGDGQPPYDPYIFLIDVNKRQESKLCLHGSSFKSYGNTQDCHPHPCFSHNSKFVVYSSDKDGSPNIYLCEI